MESSFDKMLEVKWNSLRNDGNAAKNITLKLRELRNFLKNWEKSCFGSVKERKALLCNDILELNNRSCNYYYG